MNDKFDTDRWRQFRANMMAEGMQRIEAEAAESTRTIIALEHDWRDDVRCEHTHQPGTVPCSGSVTHRISGCTKAGLICSAAAGYMQREINKGLICRHCGRDLDSCWRVEPWG